MTAPDPRVGEIEDRLSKAANMGEWSAKHPPSRDSWIAIEKPHGFTNVTAVVAKGLDHADAEFIANAPADVAYLLAELRKAREALAAVESVHYEGIAYADDVAEGRDEPVPDDYEHHFCQEDGEDWPCATMAALRAAVAAANGDGNG